MATNLIPTPERIAEVFRSADLADVNAGIDWYADAFAFAAGLADEHGISVAQAAGVISAFSPLNDWEKNKADAARFLATGIRVHTESNMSKARRILAGEDIATVLNAPKTVNFWLGIVSEGREGVCIDRHAFDIAVGVRHTDKGRNITVRLYRACAEAYKGASDILAAEGAVVTPAEVQAVTWEVWRRDWKHVRNAVAVAVA